MAWAGNAIEVLVFPGVAALGGLGTALGFAATLTLGLSVFAALCLPETKGRTPDEIYDVLCPPAQPCESVTSVECCSKETVCTNM